MQTLRWLVAIVLLLAPTWSTAQITIQIPNDTGITVYSGVASTTPTNLTPGGVPIPAGYTLQELDTFGTGQSIKNDTQMHALYNENQYFSTTGDGLTLLPNVVINSQQQTFQHFGVAEQFFSDHLEIQARGQPGGAINSEELVSKYVPLSFCVEGKYQVSGVQGVWPALWEYAYASPSHTTSEIDIESPITVGGGTNTVNNVSLAFHGSAGAIYTFQNAHYASANTLYTPSPTVDLSAAPHYYTTCFDSVGQTLTRWVDGVKVYSLASFSWTGPNPNILFDLAVGGTFPGSVSNPATFSANLDLYSIAYYTPYNNQAAVQRPGQIVQGSCAGPNGLTCTVTLNGVLGGHSVAIGIAWCTNVGCTANTTDVSTVTDSFGSTCALSTGADGSSASNNLQAQIWLCPVIASSGNDTFTVTMTATGSYYLLINVSEYTPLGADEGIGNVATGTSSTGANYPIVTTNGATTRNNDIVFAMIETASNSSLKTGAYFRTLNTGNLDEYMQATAPATYTAGWGLNSGIAYTAVIAAFYPPPPPNVTGIAASSTNCIAASLTSCLRAN